ncbi:MAG: tetratricopeptide repeat protein [bacterium]
MTIGCGSSRVAVESEKEAQGQLKSANINPRIEALVIRGSIAELIGDYKSALDAYQEAKVYDPNSPGLFLAIAQVYQKMNRFDAALEMLKQGAKADSVDIEILENLAFLYEVKQESVAAIETYKQLIALSQIDIDYRVRLASIYLRTGQNQKAITEFEQVVKLGYATSEIWRPLGLLYIQQKRYDDAMVTLQSWIDESPDDEQAYLDAGEIYKAKNDTTGLVNWYENTLQKNADFDAVRADLQAVFVQMGNLDAAVNLYEKAIAHDSTDLADVGQLAILYLQNGDTLKAKNMLERLEKATDLGNVGQLGFLYLQAGDTLKAQSMFEKLIDARPDDWRSYYNLGQLNYFSSKWPETIVYIEKAIEFNEKEPALWLMLGETYIRVDSLPRAEQAFRRAYNLAPDSKDTNYMLGFILYQQQLNQEAIPFFEKSIQADSTDFRPMGILASIYDGMGKYDLSDALYERALQLSPDNSVFNNNYSYSLAERGVRLDYAYQLVDKALKIEADNGSYLDTKGWILYQLGDYEGALEYILRSVSIRDTSAEVWEHLGDVHEKLGHYEKAVNAWRKAFEIDSTRRTLIEKLELQKN